MHHLSDRANRCRLRVPAKQLLAGGCPTRVMPQCNKPAIWSMLIAQYDVQGRFLMFFSFVFGLLAGALEPHAEPHVKKAVEDVFDLALPVERSEYDMLTLLLLLAAAGMLAALLSEVMLLPLLVGAFLGLFAKRLYGALTEVHIRPGPRDDG